MRRRTGPLGPKPTATTLARPTDIRQPGPPSAAGIRREGPRPGQGAGAGYDGGMGTVLLAAPRGYCAGVERAVDAVERALEQHGGPVYVRKQIVHNLHVVRGLEDKGAVFVDELDEVPEGAVVVLSAHGSSPTVHADAERAELSLIDATCPLVTKVHLEARRFADDDRTILLIGHAGHEEVEGTSGQAPERTILVQSVEEARAGGGPRPGSALLPHPDHAVGRRDEPDRRCPPVAVPGDPGPTSRRHLLRNPEPPGCREGGRSARRCRARDRLQELLQFQSTGRGQPRAGDPRPSGGRRERGGPGLARRRRGRRSHLRSLRPGVARRRTCSSGSPPEASIGSSRR